MSAALAEPALPAAPQLGLLPEPDPFVKVVILGRLARSADVRTAADGTHELVAEIEQPGGPVLVVCVRDPLLIGSSRGALELLASRLPAGAEAVAIGRGLRPGRMSDSSPAIFLTECDRFTPTSIDAYVTTHDRPITVTTEGTR